MVKLSILMYRKDGGVLSPSRLCVDVLSGRDGL